MEPTEAIKFLNESLRDNWYLTALGIMFIVIWISLVTIWTAYNHDKIEKLKKIINSTPEKTK